MVLDTRNQPDNNIHQGNEHYQYNEYDQEYLSSVIFNFILLKTSRINFYHQRLISAFFDDFFIWAIWDGPYDETPKKRLVFEIHRVSYAMTPLLTDLYSTVRVFFILVRYLMSKHTRFANKIKI